MLLPKSKHFINFADAGRLINPASKEASFPRRGEVQRLDRSGGMRVGRQSFFRERLSALILDQSKFSQNFYLSQGFATVDARGYVIPCFRRRYLGRDMVGCIVCIYWRGLLQLPSDLDRAMREASIGRMATDTDSYAFLFCITAYCANEGMTEAMNQA